MAIGENVQIGGDSTPPTWPISPGMRAGKLVSLSEDVREKMDFNCKPPMKTGQMEPCFVFLFNFKDDDGEVQALKLTTTQKVYTKGMVSKLYTILSGLHPATAAEYNNKDFVQKVLAALEAKANDTGVGCYLNIGVKDNGWPKIEAVLPLPKKGKNGTQAASPVVEKPLPTHFDDDEINF